MDEFNNDLEINLAKDELNALASIDFSEEELNDEPEASVEIYDDNEETAAGDQAYAYENREPKVQEYYAEQGEVSDPVEDKKAKKAAKKKKKPGFFRKACAYTISAILLGAIAGGSFYCANRLLTYRFEKSEADKIYESNKEKADKNNQIDKEDVSKLETQLTKPGSQDSSNATTTEGNMTVAQIAQTQLSSVVAITNLGVNDVQTFWGTYQQESKSAGSGVIIAKNDKELIILTNYHVVSGTKELTVVFSFNESNENAKAVAANVKGYDAERDVAVIAIPLTSIDNKTMESIKIAVVGESSKLVLGEQVVAIGNALGYGQSVTTGIVSALDRHMELDGTENNKISNDYIQTDAAINPGNSGGALYNMRGELIGINSAKVGGTQVEGMGYAIPMDNIKDLVTKLMNLETLVALSEEEQGYLGIGGTDVDANSAMYGVPEGVYVTAVAEKGAAEKAGIKKGDIISKINDKSVKSMSEMKKELSYIKGGAKIQVTVYRFDNGRRSYEELTFDVTLDDYKTFKKISEKMTQED